MSVFRDLLQAGYIFVILPSIGVILGAWLIGVDEQGRLTRRSSLFLLSLAALALAMLGLLIWTNPYGKELSSSLPAFGVLPVLVALLALIIYKRTDLSRLWETDKAFLATLGLIILILLGFLWLAEHLTFYLVILCTSALFVAWWIGVRSGLGLMMVLSLAIAGTVVFAAGGDFLLVGLESPAWSQIVVRIAAGVAMILTIFLAGVVLYTGLRTSAALNWQRIVPRLSLVVFLLGGCAYYVYWDGVWSSAHARALEDHLPFGQFLFSLMGGILLALTLKGWRRLAGPAFIIFVTAATTLALVIGWTVSAFEITETRAARVDQALAEFHEDNGRYPANLGELTPNYLLYLSPPVVVKENSWCYQDGEGGYRLGYVSGSFTYFEADFYAEIYAVVGNPPQERWTCDDLAEKYEAGEINY